MSKHEDKSTVLLKHYLKALKMPTILAECEKVAARCAKENVDHLGFLLQLCELELLDRERRAAERRLKAAKFPGLKTLDTFDFKARPPVNKPLVLELMRGEYIDKRENVLLVGNSGTGSDIHRHVINLAKVCAHPQLGPELYRRLRRLPFHPEVLRQAQERCLEWESAPETWEPILDWAVDYFVAVWMNRAGAAGTKGEFSGALSVRWKAGGGDSSTRYHSAARSIVAWRSVFRRCTFVTCDCFAFLGKVQDLPRHGVYCDPPFLGQGAKYKHTFTEQHRDLATALSRFRQTRVAALVQRIRALEQTAIQQQAVIAEQQETIAHQAAVIA